MASSRMCVISSTFIAHLLTEVFVGCLDGICARYRDWAWSMASVHYRQIHCFALGK